MGTRIGPIIAAIGLCLLALYASFDIAGSNGNPVISMLKYVSGMSFLIGVVMPRASFYWLFLVSAYLNLIKRFSVFDSPINFMEVIISNLPPAMCVAGICFGTVFGMMTGKLQVTKTHIFGIFIAGGLAALTVAAKMLGGEGAVGGGLNGAVNAGAFLFLIPMAAIHFKNADEMVKLFRWICFVSVPVALYGVVQAFNGFSWWEEVFEFGAQLNNHAGLGDTRAFSTLNSAISLSSVMAICAGISIYLMSRKRRDELGIGMFVGVVLFLVFLLGLGSTMRRSGIFLLVAVFVARFAFSRKSTTLLLYGSGAAGVLSLYLFSGFFLEWSWDNRKLAFFSDSDYVNRMVQFSTWQDRFAGFNNMMTNPKLWEPFGVSSNYVSRNVGDDITYLQNLGTATDFSDLRGNTYTHDVISNSIVTYGYIPVAIAGIAGIFFLVKVHGRLLALPLGSTERRDYCWMLSICAGILASGITSIQAISIFPVNVFAYTIFGFAVQLWLNAGASSRALAGSVIAQRNSRLARPPRAMPRFAQDSTGR